MKINENMLRNSVARVEKSRYADPFIYTLAKPIISGETYTFSYEGEVDEGVTNIGIYNSGGTVQEFISLIAGVKVKDNRKFVTFVAKDQTRTNAYLSIYFPPSNIDVWKWMEKAKLEEGTEATPWIPHRNDLTETQRNLMPEHLFGGGIEWKEITAI